MIETQQKWYIRFTIFERIEHFVLILSFTTLGVTGLVQKYALNAVSQSIIAFLGGIETTRILHHIAAAVFLLEAVYHLVAVGYKIYIQNKKPTMLPGIKDGTDAVQWLGYNLGFLNKLPKMPRYNFMEKMEYWAMLWGLLIMALTGLMLWNPIFVTRYLPGEFIPAAKAAHGGEAILAVLAIFLWHFYNVHIKHWNWGMIRGKISRHEMVEEHGQELDEIESGMLPVPPSPVEARRRLMLYVPTAAIFTIVLAAAIYLSLTFETTSITTLPPADQVQAYVRATLTPMPPTPTTKPQPTSLTGANQTIAWTGTIDQMLKTTCGSCHGTSGGFNADTYQNVMKEVKAGNPDDSKIVQIQKIGTHPGQLSADQLNTLIAWIKAGAPETAGAASSTGTTTAASGKDSWASGISNLFVTKCGTCHGTTAGFTATTYNDVIKQLKPGDPDNSNIVTVQKKGGHPGQFSADELTRVINWIKAGAPEQ